MELAIPLANAKKLINDYDTLNKTAHISINVKSMTGYYKTEIVIHDLASNKYMKGFEVCISCSLNECILVAHGILSQLTRQFEQSEHIKIDKEVSLSVAVDPIEKFI
ncbi:hypothetical protein [Priestia flexa]|uniref:hypothetical protein n=1 Tax=Priestia flexa TaxID=86664 RepID=UPI0004742B65|nr:hypothetical protein [Priestia flexa]